MNRNNRYIAYLFKLGYVVRRWNFPQEDVGRATVTYQIEGLLGSSSGITSADPTINSCKNSGSVN
jgi:hypothetical protein